MGKRHNRHRMTRRFTRACIEQLEDRRLLTTTKADIVFVVDESGSENQNHEWLSAMITGDTIVEIDGQREHVQIPSLAERLRDEGIGDVRYGLVGFGNAGRFAHSHIVDKDPDSNQSLFDSLWSDGDTPADHAADLREAIATLEAFGQEEDGWDGIEHALAEYKFRQDAIPVVVLLQGEGSRRADLSNANRNPTLTHDGMLAALRSKNVIVNTMTVGFDNESTVIADPLFNLSLYGLDPDLRVLGVEADARYGGNDGIHNFYAVDTNDANGIVSPGSTVSDTLQVSFSGSNTGDSGMVGSGKSILISPNITDGIGPTAQFNYRARSLPFHMESIDGSSPHTFLSNSINFDFTFFGTPQTKLWVNQDGTITFPTVPGASNFDPGPSNLDLSHPPTTGADARLTLPPMIAALWDDLETGTSAEPIANAGVRTLSTQVDGDGVSDLIIQWNNFRYASDTTLFDPVTFQVILYSNGNIGINYQDVDGFTHRDDGDMTVLNNGGISATVGIWKGSSSPTSSIPANRFVPGLHSLIGQNSGSGESNDSYVRMAWDTGGAAWDLGVVREFQSSGLLESRPAVELRERFTVSLGEQINDAALHGRFARTETVLISANYGGPAVEGFSAEPSPPSGSTAISTSGPIDITSNSIPISATTGSKVNEVFKTARRSSAAEMLFSGLGLETLTAGRYVVEIYFSHLASVSNFRRFDVVAEGKTLLNDYRILIDAAKIQQFNSSNNELETVAGNFVGIVKRFAVDVDANGLQLLLRSESSEGWQINGLRILRPDIPGDYNRNGKIDNNDYTVWRDTLFAHVPAFSGADGNGDGEITAADYAIWKNQYVAIVFGGPARVPGDFDGNGQVDQYDRAIWYESIGSTTDLRADANFNGIVDLTDLEILQAFYRVTTLDTIEGDFNSDRVVDTSDYDLWVAGSIEADADGDGQVAGDIDDFAIWQTNFGFVGADVFPLVIHGTDGMPLEIPDAAPIVAGVSIGSYGFATATGSGEQLRSLPTANPNSVSIRFSEEVFVTLNSLQVINLDGASPTNVTSFVYDLATQTATWTFNSSLADGRTLLRLSDSVFDLDHELLDGEFLNPWTLNATGSSTLPSGDGEAGGEFRFRFTVLAGDTDHNNIHGAANYQNWHSVEPGRAIASTTADEFDSNLAYGDLSLREAIHFANIASEATTIELPSGRYSLTITGTEAAGTAQNDLDILGNVTILGAGAGVSVIAPNWSYGVPVQENRVFDVNGAAARLRLQRATVTGTYSWASPLGAAALVRNQADLEIVESAIVNNTGYGTGIAVRSLGSDVTVLRSVFTNNQGYDGVAIEASEAGGHNGSLTIGESIFALNTNWGGYSGTTPNVKATSSVAKTNLGKNLYDNSAGGFFNVVSGVGDYLGTPHYVVTTVADTFDNTNDMESLSLREAVDKANTTSGTQTIWLPAWDFVLTRDRGTNTTDISASYGDLDVKDSLVVRGITDRTSIAWKPGVVDKVFDLIGDFNNDGQSDYGSVSSADYTIWQSQNGSSGAWEQYSADADDDGDVDVNDYDLWLSDFGHSLSLTDVET